MQINNIIARTTKRLVLLATLAVGLFAGQAHASSISIECKVAGYSLAGWIQVRPGSNTGGRVQYDAAHAVYFTDRVSRGESMRLTFKPTVAGEFAYWGDIFPETHYSLYKGYFANVWLPFAEVLTCPTDPSWDNVYAEVCTTAPYPNNYNKLRIPIGSR